VGRGGERRTRRGWKSEFNPCRGVRNCSYALVGAAGFEPAAPCSQSRCSTRLSYAPSRNLRGLSSSFLTSWKWTRREQSDNTDTTPEIRRTVRSRAPQRAEHLARWRVARWRDRSWLVTPGAPLCTDLLNPRALSAGACRGALACVDTASTVRRPTCPGEDNLILISK
jgi:hypothetical protein